MMIKKNNSVTWDDIVFGLLIIFAFVIPVTIDKRNKNMKQRNWKKIIGYTIVIILIAITFYYFYDYVSVGYPLF